MREKCGRDAPAGAHVVCGDELNVATRARHLMRSGTTGFEVSSLEPRDQHPPAQYRMHLGSGHGPCATRSRTRRVAGSRCRNAEYTGASKHRAPCSAPSMPARAPASPPRRTRLSASRKLVWPPVGELGTSVQHSPDGAANGRSVQSVPSWPRASCTTTEAKAVVYGGRSSTNRGALATFGPLCILQRIVSGEKLSR